MNGRANIPTDEHGVLSKMFGQFGPRVGSRTMSQNVEDLDIIYFRRPSNQCFHQCLRGGTTGTDEYSHAAAQRAQRFVCSHPALPGFLRASYPADTHLVPGISRPNSNLNALSESRISMMKATREIINDARQQMNSRMIVRTRSTFRNAATNRAMMRMAAKNTLITPQMMAC